MDPVEVVVPPVELVVPPVGAAVPVAEKITGLPERVPEEAVTLFSPAEGPSVNMVDANPCAFVVALVVLRVPPPLVTANVTATPEIAVPLASVTSTTNVFASDWPAVPVWPVPLTIVRFAGPLPLVGFVDGFVALPEPDATPLNLPIQTSPAS